MSGKPGLIPIRWKLQWTLQFCNYTFSVGWSQPQFIGKTTFRHLKCRSRYSASSNGICFVKSGLVVSVISMAVVGLMLGAEPSPTPGQRISSRSQGVGLSPRCQKAKLHILRTQYCHTSSCVNHENNGKDELLCLTNQDGNKTKRNENAIFRLFRNAGNANS